MTESNDFKITYTTLSSPSEEVHRSFEEAVRNVEQELAHSHPLWIDGCEETATLTFEDRSPIDRNIALGTFQRVESEQVGRAIESAAAAYTRWSRTPWPRRRPPLP